MGGKGPDNSDFETTSIWSFRVTEFRPARHVLRLRDMELLTLLRSSLSVSHADEIANTNPTSITCSKCSLIEIIAKLHHLKLKIIPKTQEAVFEFSLP